METGAILHCGTARRCTVQGQAMSPMAASSSISGYMICTMNAYYPHVDCKAAPIGYWHISGGPEVDVVIERAGALTAIECKWGEHPEADAEAKGFGLLTGR